MRIAYIDIGYNALRAVVYERACIGSPEIFSEKFKSNIQALLTEEDLDIKNQTYLAFSHLLHIFKQLCVTEVKCVATAVLRDHPRAPEFQKIIKQKFNIDIEILSGEREARLTAMGLISGINNAYGIAADLGGGSLELASIKDRKTLHIKSLELGTKIMETNNINDAAIIVDAINKEFGAGHYPTLYFIGGALRFIGRFYMEFINYPLKNLHNFEVPAVDFFIYLEKLDHLYKIKQASQYKRIDYHAILAAKAMIEVFTPEKIIISNYGLKEGVRFATLPESEQQKDVIYERIKELLVINDDILDLDKYNNEVYKLLIKPDNSMRQIINYALMLSQFNKNIDKTLRMNFVVEFVLASDIPFNHRERIMIALALAAPYNPKFDSQIARLAKKMLNKADYHNAQIIGNFIKIARLIDGPEFAAPSFKLQLQDPYIQIATAEILHHQIFEKIFERIKDIARLRKIMRSL
jgi:exopolyphosphatase / guanosine-5'-triphosphate,3'-diphosphate pyrophosphatase